MGAQQSAPVVEEVGESTGPVLVKVKLQLTLCFCQITVVLLLRAPLSAMSATSRQPLCQRTLSSSTPTLAGYVACHDHAKHVRDLYMCHASLHFKSCAALQK
jgi:hypothetical protein